MEKCRLTRGKLQKSAVSPGWWEAGVLVSESRLGELDVAELREVITEAWVAMAPKRLSKQYIEGA